MEAVTLQLPADNSCFGNDMFSKLGFFSRFRRHPGFSEADIAAINHYDAMSVTQSALCGSLYVADHNAAALVAINTLPWESDFFGMHMGKLYFSSTPGLPENMLSTLLAKTLLSAHRDHGICHLSIEVDIDDYTSLNCLLKHGFEIMDLKRTYFTNAINSTSHLEKGSRLVRPYDKSDLDAVTAIIEQARFETRFTRDQHIDAVLANKMYKQWFHQIIAAAGQTANVIVYCRNGQVVGCGGVGEMSFLKYGLDNRLRTGSLYASLPSGVGGYGPVLYRLTTDAIRTHGLIEATVSLNNTAAARVVEGIRPNRSISVYCLRKHVPAHG